MLNSYEFVPDLLNKENIYSGKLKDRVKVNEIFNEIDIADFVINALRLYSLFFLTSLLPSLLIFYYEAIEISAFSTFISVLYTLVMPLVSIFVLYNLIRSNGIWIGFTVGDILILIIIYISVKLIQKREPKYSGLFFIEKDLVDKTRNFVLTDNDLNARSVLKTENGYKQLYARILIRRKK